VAGACILPDNYFIPGINDSKQLTPKERERIYQILIEDERVMCGVGIVDSDVIDRVNIYQATIHAMLLAIGDLTQLPDYMLVDGMKLPGCIIPHSKEIKGDARSQTIAAASVIAKVTRDRIMLEYDERWPMYGFSRHKGYGTPEHIEAIHRHGPCSIHRSSFEPLKSLVLV
jgi:ribonuclease HII